MATVNGMTAEAMEAIQNGSVVTGTVNEDGHLILTTFGGSTIDAGSVVGPTGSTGATGASGSSQSLDQIAAANATQAAWSNNSFKIEHVANGSASDDVAALGQVMQKIGGAFTGGFAPAATALTFGTLIPIDASTGNVFPVTLTSSAGVLGNPTNPTAWQEIIVPVTQDSTGSRTLAYGTAFKFTTALPSPTLTTTAGATDLLKFIYNPNESKWILIAFLPAV